MAKPYRRLLETGAIVDRILNGTGSDDSSYDTTTSQFDTNMVIILAVLLCALMFALALNFIAPCGLRFIFSNRSHEPAPEAVPGLKKRALRKLSEGVFGPGPNILVTECSICLGEFVDGERVRVLPICSHGFHVGCIDRWLMSHASCPNCRMPVLEPPPACTA